MIYLDNAATSFPKPDTVPRAVYDIQTRLCANPGRSGHRMSIICATLIMHTREWLADLFRAEDPFQFVFCQNCTDALNTAMKGCLRPGDHVVSTMMEHNSVLRVLTHLKLRGFIDVTWVYPGADTIVSPEDMAAALRPNTRLVVMTQASNVTGAVQPFEKVAALCRQRGILFLLDAAQGAGIVPTDLSRTAIDMMAFPGHKGLYGPQGTGGLYIRPGLELVPLREGGTGSLSDSWEQPLDLPDRYESGTMNTPGLAGLSQGIRFLRNNGHEVHETERKLTKRLYEGLANMKNIRIYTPADPDARVGVVSFNIGNKQSGEVADYLNTQDIAVRGGLHCAPGVHEVLGTLDQGAVRVSLGAFNTPADIDAILLALERYQEAYPVVYGAAGR